MKPNSQVPIEERWKADAGFSILPPRGNADGGPGSGNHGHKGVPGQVGGSAPSTSGPISKSSFQKGSGHFEITGDVKDMYLTKPARTRIEGAIKTVKTANDLKKYLENQGIKLETSYEPLKKAMDREIPSIKEQADYVIAAIEQYKDLGGLKALKAVHIYDHDIDAQAQYSYRAKGEGAVPDEGHLYISYMADGAQIMHEFAHAYADSTKPDGMDVVEWSAKLNREAGLSKNVKAYFGADSDAKEAERFANAMGYAIADGDGPDGRLSFAANVANIVRNSNGSSAGMSGGNLTFKSMIPKDSYFNTSSYNKAVEDFRSAIRKHDEAWKKYRELEKALKSESTPKPESEWNDNDIFEDLIGHRPMTYTEKGKKIKSEMDKTFKDACVYDHEQTETGDKLREIKKKEHDKQVKDIHFQPPADASSDDYEGFTTKTTGTSAYDDYLNGEKHGGRIAEMSPAEYLQRCAYQVFEDATIESTLAAIDESNVEKYADMMKNGTKFDMPYLNFMSGQQEGRHRAAAAMQAGIDKIPVLVVGERFAKYDGGPGSGNFNHEGRPGEIGGSAPKGSADCAASVQKLSTLKDGFSNLTAKQQYVYLSRSGVIPNSELETLKAGATSGDPEAIKTLKQYEEDYFYNAEYGRTVKSLDCEMRDEVTAMSKEEARDWISQSTSRELYDYEQWANPNSDAQKVAIDLGMVETPQVVSKDDFNKYVEESGAVVCYRGVKNTPDMSGASMLYQMAYNTQENYFGDGIYGDGLYFSTDQNTAVAYAHGSEAVAMCAIRPDAKVIDYKSPEIEKARKELGTSDYAVAAMCSGYDAIKVKMGGNEDYYVVLNRAAMVMADPVDKFAGTAINAIDRAKNGSSASRKPASVQLRDVASACDYIDKIAKKAAENGASSRDSYKAAIAVFEQNGFDGIPRTLSKEKFEKEESDYPNMYLGFKNGASSSDFINGEMKLKDGSDGYGIYASGSATGAKFSAGSHGTILTAKLAKGAKVISDDDLVEKYQKIAERSSGFSEKTVKDLYDELSGNPGCLAAALGYDAIYAKSSGKMNILNRSQLIVQELD